MHCCRSAVSPPVTLGEGATQIEREVSSALGARSQIVHFHAMARLHPRAALLRSELRRFQEI